MEKYVGSFLVVATCLWILSVLASTAFAASENGARSSNEDFIALRYGRTLADVKHALERGADANARSNKGWTPLMIAARRGNLEVAALLLNKGADLNARSNKGWTPLMVATERGHLEVASLLMDKGAGANAKDSDGKRAIDHMSPPGKYSNGEYRRVYQRLKQASQ